MSKTFKTVLTPSPNSDAKPRFRVFNKRGELWMVAVQKFTVEEARAFQAQLSRAVVAAVLHKASNPKAP